jgi:hypothetical protein
MPCWTAATFSVYLPGQRRWQVLYQVLSKDLLCLLSYSEHARLLPLPGSSWQYLFPIDNCNLITATFTFHYHHRSPCGMHGFPNTKPCRLRFVLFLT